MLILRLFKFIFSVLSCNSFDCLPSIQRSKNTRINSISSNSIELINYYTNSLLMNIDIPLQDSIEGAKYNRMKR